MIKNDISIENEKDISGEEEKLLGLLVYKQKEYLKQRYAEEVAHCIMLWFKYYRKESISYYNLANSYIMPLYNYSESETKDIIDLSKKILEEKYFIKIQNEKPLILFSDNEMYK